jgi:hypothetical protein
MLRKSTLVSFVAFACLAVVLSACGSKSKKSCTVSGDCAVTKMCQDLVCVNRPTCSPTCDGDVPCINGVCMDCLTTEDCTTAGMICNTDYVCAYEKCDITPCGTHGTCDDSTGQFVCTCDTANGYTGTRCDQCLDGYQLSGSDCVLIPTCATQGEDCDPDVSGVEFDGQDGTCNASLNCLRKICRSCTADENCLANNCECADATCSVKRCFPVNATACEYVIMGVADDDCQLTNKAENADCGVCCKCDASGNLTEDLSQNSDCSKYTEYTCTSKCSALNTCAYPSTLVACGGKVGCAGNCNGSGHCDSNADKCSCLTTLDYGVCVEGVCVNDSACGYCGARGPIKGCPDPLQCCSSTRSCALLCRIIFELP